VFFGNLFFAIAPFVNSYVLLVVPAFSGIRSIPAICAAFDIAICFINSKPFGGFGF
jgi:hypothetical protein